MTPEEAVKALSISKWWFSDRGLRDAWQTQSRLSRTNTPALFSQPLDAGKIYNIVGLHDVNGSPSEEESRNKAVNAVLALGLVQDRPDVGMARYMDTDNRMIIDYVALPADKISLGRMEEMNRLCKSAASGGIEEIGHLIGYPEFTCWAPKNPAGKLTACIDYGYGGGVRRDRLDKVVETVWKPLGLVAVKGDSELRAQREIMAAGSFSGAGFFYLDSDARDPRPLLYINLEHPGIMEKAQALLAHYKAAGLAGKPGPSSPAP